RARYANEMLALIEMDGLSWRQIVDLAWACVEERALWLVEPGRGSSSALGPSLAGAVLVHAIGSLLRPANWTAPTWGEAMMGLPFFALNLVVAAAALWRLTRLRRGMAAAGMSPARVRVLLTMILATGILADIVYPGTRYPYSSPPWADGLIRL